MHSTEDLKRLVDDAARDMGEVDTNDGPGPLMVSATELLRTTLLLVTSPSLNWAEVRMMVLRAAYLCLLAAWEAGKRPQCGRLGPLDYHCEKPRGHADGKRCAEEPHEGGGWRWDYVNPAVRVESTKPTAPVTNAVYVDALLDRTAKWFAAGTVVGAWDLLRDLYASLRTERQLRADASEAEWQTRLRVDAAFGHLRAVLAHYAPKNVTIHRCAREAWVFLEGAEVAPSGDAKEAERLRKELDDERAKLRRIFDALEFTLGNPSVPSDVNQAVEHAATLRRMVREESYTNTRAKLANALAAQNRAESERNTLEERRAFLEKRADHFEAEAAGLRSDLAGAIRDREDARKDRDAAVDQVAAYRAENLTVRAENQSLQHKLEALETGIRGIIDRVAKGKA